MVSEKKVGETLSSVVPVSPGSESPRGESVSSLHSEQRSPQADDNDGYQLIELGDGHVLVEFSDGSIKNPNNWSTGKKTYMVLAALFLVMNSGISASLPSNCVPAIMEEFHIQGKGQNVLPTAIFLIGYVVGPLVLSPLSETIGRRPVLSWTLTAFVLGTLACALAPSWASLLVFRLVCGLAGAAPQTVVGGLYADLFDDQRTRGRVMAFYMAASSFGPIIGPIISGFAVQYGWRWTFRIDVILAGCCWLYHLFMSETFAPAILKKQAAKLNKVSGSTCHVSRKQLQAINAKSSFVQTFTRPITMLVTEPIVLCSSIYIALAYSLIFFYFQAYPIIFQQTYNFDEQSTSLAYIPMGIGAVCSGLFTFYYDTIYEKAKARGKPWTASPEMQRLPLSCIAGPCLTISLFWLAWTANRSVHWMAPVLSGLLFGLGYQTIFISLLTYVTDAYRIYSASALAASVILRSIVGALFPLAADPLYASLGVAWGTSVVGFISVACVPIPMVFLYAGPWIRKRSRFCQRLLREDEEMKGIVGGVRGVREV
ncbi:MFS multidrug transporter [Aspergillus campestris IBT 28561]|uniref:MFS multidrug transporter n=1 Tax=Aspergillus campestris (strain IBT 28561) TaxID=1392248 RepID=A0A2I1DGP2_ASPC2|nr:MFS multidrug transporter [Aspergillus campestris IBT 28561]PKY09043.1 MFS multidrug transporter [Aspergillus campestris IBT 28561]